MAANTAANVAAEDDGWEDVPTETQMVFDTDGDRFEGRFAGWTESAKGIPQAHFTDAANAAFFVNCGWSLKSQLKPIKVGTMVRITRTGTQDTGQESPMVLFRVQTKK